jgi:hypothetical protein
VNQIRKWLRDEPIATRVGPAVVLVAGYLLARGVIDADTADLIVALVALVAGGGAVLGARALVSPLSKLLRGPDDRPEG